MTKYFKLFCGYNVYPLGGYEDFKGYFDNIEDVKQHMLDEYPSVPFMWAQIVYEDKIVLNGKTEWDTVGKKTPYNVIWIWYSYE